VGLGFMGVRVRVRVCAQVHEDCGCSSCSCNNLDEVES
jgi:hypothetical protein